MSAELLRRAAKVMRGRAEAATPGPWGYSAAANPRAVLYYDGDGEPYVLLGTHPLIDGGVPPREEDAEHIASWHPAVALAVADWLDAAARDADRSGSTNPPAEDAARAYLGEQASA